MSSKKKKELRWAIKRTNYLLEINAGPSETFEGVLNRMDVRALRTLVGFTHQALAVQRGKQGQSG